MFTPQSHNQKYCSYTCRWNTKIEKSELQTPITADVEHQIKQLVAKFGEKKVREVEIYGRDNYVKIPDFERAVERLSADFKSAVGEIRDDIRDLLKSKTS